MKILRRIVAAIVLLALVAAFVAPGAAVAASCAHLTRIQLVPAILAGSVAVLVALAISVALCGRLYCSVVCPLGISQDLVRWLAKLCRIPAKPLRGGNWQLCVRMCVLAVFSGLCGIGLVSVIEPYGIFGRFLSTGVMRFGEPATLAVAWSIGLFALIVLVAAVLPRGWCNTVCPVGTFLGFFSRFAFFRVRIDRSKCVKCGLCVRACEKGALTVGEDKSIVIDSSRCVVCGNCSCVRGALKWR